MTPVVDLETAVRTGPTMTRQWDMGASSTARRLGSSLVLVEAPRFPENDPDQGAAAVMEERGHSARKVVVTSNGSRVSGEGYDDHDIAFSATGLYAVARRHSSEALGIPAGGDFIAAHRPSLGWGAHSQWSRVGLLPGHQPYVGAPGRNAEPQSFLFSTQAVAISPSGDRVAFVEWRTGAQKPGYALWEQDLTSGARRWLGGEPEGEHWGTARISYSPCGQWILIASSPNRVMRTSDGASFSLPASLAASAWWPGELGRLVATGSDSQTSAPLFRVSLVTGDVAHIADLRGHTARGLMMHGLTVSPDGFCLAGIAPLGLDLQLAEEDGSGNRAFVIDLHSFKAEVVLPVRFACGVERDIERVSWVEGVVASDGFTLHTSFRDDLMPPIAKPLLADELASSMREQAARGAQVIAQALDDHGVDVDSFKRELVRFCAAVLEYDPSSGALVEQIRQWAYGKFIQTLQVSGRERAKGWLDINNDLQTLGEGRPALD